MHLELGSIRRITTTTPEMVIAKISARNDSENGYTDVVFEVEIKNTDFMNMTLKHIESLAVERALSVIGK